MQLGGYNIMTDPVFSKRASPLQFVGPARYTPPACKVADLPPVHIVLISHNHYDHVDYGSIRDILKMEATWRAASQLNAAADEGGNPHVTRAFTGTLFVCPLKVASLLQSCGVSPDRIVELDWWTSFQPGASAGSAAATGAGTTAGAAATGADSSSAATRVSMSPHAVHGTLTPNAHAPVSATAAAAAAAAATPLRPDLPIIVAVPAQHQSARSTWDRNKTLWCGYVVSIGTPTPANGDVEPGASAPDAGGDAALPADAAVSRGTRFYFSGDTGYGSVEHGAPEEAVATVACPAFEEIGRAYGPMDLSFLPLGAYSPRWFMSSFHCSPEDSVELHTLVRSRRSVGMHWGSFALTDEPVEEPPERLEEALRRKGLPQSSFIAVYPGSAVAAQAGALDARYVINTDEEEDEEEGEEGEEGEEEEEEEDAMLPSPESESTPHRSAA
ncbi:hypothetical protein EON66_03770 [archaeon]|nr:MAG: hypothetical protein EON66_03770 [archaeon]